MTSLAGQLLIAMPQMEDPRFSRSVVFMCAHNAEGAMGLVVNKTVEQPSMCELLQQLGVDGDGFKRARVHFGGPVEAARGFVLHSTDYTEQATLVVGDVGLTATIDMLRAIGRGDGPRQRFFALRPCRLGARPARCRDPGEWLAHRAIGRCVALRRDERRQMAARDRHARRRSLRPFRRRRPRVAHHTSSLRGARSATSNPKSRARKLDCFVASLLAMTLSKNRAI